MEENEANILEEVPRFLFTGVGEQREEIPADNPGKSAIGKVKLGWACRDDAGQERKQLLGQVSGPFLVGFTWARRVQKEHFGLVNQDVKN